MRYKPSRRDLLVLSGGFLCSTIARRTQAQAKPKVAALFAGKIDDSGFMEAGYRGLIAARDKLGVEVFWQDQIKPERDLLAAALRVPTEPHNVAYHDGLGRPFTVVTPRMPASWR